MQEDAAQTLLKFQTRKDVVYLYKRLLTIVEDIRDEHFFMLDKLEKTLPSSYHSLLRNSNYMDDTKFNLLRKRVLDAGNDTARQIEEQISKFEVQFK